MKTYLIKYFGSKVTYDPSGAMLWINGEGRDIIHLADVRGWGHIQNLFKANGKIDEDAAAKFQDQIGEFIAEAINEKLRRPFSSSGEAEPTKREGIISDEEIEAKVREFGWGEYDGSFLSEGNDMIRLAKWMRSEMLRRSSGAAVTAEDIEKEARKESLKMKPDDPFLQAVFEMGYKAGASRLSSVVAESPAKPIDEQKILDTYVGRFLRGVIDKVSPEAVESDKSSWDERFFRIYPHAKETLLKVEDALNEFVVDSAESPAGEGKPEPDWKGQYEDARCEIADLKEQLNDAVGEIRQLNSELRIRGANPIR